MARHVGIQFFVACARDGLGSGICDFTAILLGFSIILSSGCHEPTASTSGAIAVTVSTAGANIDPDPDGYALSVDGGPDKAVGVNATVTVADLPTGNHQVRLDGVASNCSVAGANPRSVDVIDYAKAPSPVSVLFSVSCIATIGSPTELVAQGETEFTATVGTTIEPGPAVRVLDENHRPVARVSVSFGPERSKVVVTDADGIARFGAWQLDTLAGAYFIEARVAVSVQRELGVVFQGRATPGPVVHFTASSGNNQVGEPTTTLPNQLHARATDIYNNPVGGLLVTFSVVSGGGIIELSTSTTNTLGLATAGRWTLGSTSPQRVSARAGDFEALFDATFCETGHPCDLVPVNLAYVRDGAVWISGADGPRLVAHDASRPSWSPDGSRLAFFKVNANREEEAICIAAEPFSGMVCTPVDEPLEDMRDSWSPDGRTLALSGMFYGSGNSQLLFLDVATMTIRRHGTIDQSVRSASWSPDGKKIAIASDAKVYLANAGGSELEVLLPYPVWELAWAPDGQKIAVITLGCDWDCFGADLALLDPKTKELTVLERGQGGLTALTWSADSNRLAYSVWVSASGMGDVRIMNIADGASNDVLTNASDPSWRP